MAQIPAKAPNNDLDSLNRDLGKILLWGSLVVMIVLFIASQNQPSKPSSASRTCYTGAHCTIADYDVRGLQTLEVRPELEKSLSLGDHIGVQELVAKGKVFPLLNGTELLALDSDFDLWSFSIWYKVRVLSGPYYGEAVWVKSADLQAVLK